MFSCTMHVSKSFPTQFCTLSRCSGSKSKHKGLAAEIPILSVGRRDWLSPVSSAPLCRHKSDLGRKHPYLQEFVLAHPAAERRRIDGLLIVVPPEKTRRSLKPRSYAMSADPSEGHHDKPKKHKEEKVAAAERPRKAESKQQDKHADKTARQMKLMQKWGGLVQSLRDASTCTLTNLMPNYPIPRSWRSKSEVRRICCRARTSC